MLSRILTVFLIVFCLPFSAPASEPVPVGGDLTFLPIDRQADVLFDPTHRLTFRDISSPEYSRRFSPHKTQGFNFGMSDDAIWLRFKLNIKPSVIESNGLLLALDKTTFPLVTLYLPTGTASKSSYSEIGGSYRNRTQDQTLQYRYPVFKIPSTLPKDRYVYLYINPLTKNLHASSNFNLFLTDTVDFIHRTWVETSFYYLIFGVLLSMIVYNLFLSFFLKETVYYLYICYVALILMYIFLRSGFHIVAGFPGLSVLVLHTVSGAYIMAIAFSQSFLSTRKYCPVLNVIMWGFMMLCGLVLAFQSLGFPKAANMLMHIIGAGGPLVAVVAGFLRLYQGYKPARYYLAAWLSLLAGVISLSLVGLGVLPKKFFFFNSLAIGSMAEAILLSTALGDRIRLLRDETWALQQKERRLTELSITDELTGLFNKRWFSSKLKSEVTHSHRVSQPLSLIIIDVDHFKKFNDTHGHAAGDKVLEKLGEVIIEGIRDNDIGSRFGGEEFTVILPAAGLAKAVSVAERLRTIFETSDIVIKPDKTVTSTISIGVAELAQGETQAQLFERADRALYVAKQKGRNRIEKAD